jgi:hypothetical protein
VKRQTISETRYPTYVLRVTAKGFRSASDKNAVLVAREAKNLIRGRFDGPRVVLTRSEIAKLAELFPVEGKS